MGFFSSQFAVQPSDVIAFSVSQRTAVEMQVTLSIADESTWLYRNLKHPRFKNFYGYAQLMSGAFVVADIPLNFLNQELLHWREETFGINDTTICTAKILGTGFSPQLAIPGFVVKVRQRFTSIRFRLLPGIVANVSYVWESAQSKCDNEAREPDGKQGQPPQPNNSGSSGGGRPGDQGGDGADPSANDGNFDSAGGLPPPPSPGGGGGVATWKVRVAGYRQDDSAYVATVDSGIADPAAVVSAFISPNPGSNPNDGGKSNSKISFIVNGVTIGTGGSGWGLNLFSPYYGQ